MISIKNFPSWFKLSLCISFSMLINACAAYKRDITLPLTCQKPTVPIHGFAQAFVGNQPLQNARILILEKQKIIKTTTEGKFTFCALPSERITLLLFQKNRLFWNNYITTQSATFIVPKEGMIGKDKEITFQAPRNISFELLKAIITHDHKFNLLPNRCNVATTVTAFGKTLKDDLQGEAGAKLILSQNGQIIKNPNILYFDVLMSKTNPFKTHIQTTSKDGGAVIYNLMPSDKLYYLSAKKDGLTFTTEAFLCRPGAFINLSPPHGPTVKKE